MYSTIRHWFCTFSQSCKTSRCWFDKLRNGPTQHKQEHDTRLASQLRCAIAIGARRRPLQLLWPLRQLPLRNFSADVRAVTAIFWWSLDKSLQFHGFSDCLIKVSKRILFIFIASWTITYMYMYIVWIFMHRDISTPSKLHEVWSTYKRVTCARVFAFLYLNEGKDLENFSTIQNHDICTVYFRILSHRF